MHQRIHETGPSQAGGRGGGGAHALPLFGRSANSISTRGGILSLPSNTGPPEFSDLATALCDFFYMYYFISRPLTDIVKTTRIDPNLFVFFAKNVDQDMVGSTWEVKIINLHI